MWRFKKGDLSFCAYLSESWFEQSVLFFCARSCEVSLKGEIFCFCSFVRARKVGPILLFLDCVPIESGASKEQGFMCLPLCGGLERESISFVLTMWFVSIRGFLYLHRGLKRGVFLLPIGGRVLLPTHGYSSPMKSRLCARGIASIIRNGARPTYFYPYFGISLVTNVSRSRYPGL